MESIAQYKRESRSEIQDFYAKTIDADNLASLMEQRGVKKKKDDIQDFSSYVSSLLQDETSAILKGKSDALAKDIDDFLDAFEGNTTIHMDGGISFHVPLFSKEQAFAAGLAGLATYGALAIWASTCGNLGGYILVAKGISLLSALGISVGGTAAGISAVASIGGPVVLGIALALVAAAAAFAIFSGGWRKNIARKLVDACRKEKALDKLCEGSDTYWEDTRKAFKASADSLDAKWMQHLSALREELDGYDVEKIEKAKQEAEAMRNFIQNIPCCGGGSEAVDALAIITQETTR
jgi:ElaB/YqjD/DUF883 family membrane-anchored ribosome-binding protein